MEAITVVDGSVRIKIVVEGGNTVVVKCRRPSAHEKQKFLNSRFVTHRNKTTSRLYEARAEFFDRIAIDAENVAFESAAGEQLPLNAATVFTEEDKKKWKEIMGVPITSWKDLIDVAWKSSVIMRFEDSAAVPDEEEEGSDSKN